MVLCGAISWSTLPHGDTAGLQWGFELLHYPGHVCFNVIKFSVDGHKHLIRTKYFKSFSFSQMRITYGILRNIIYMYYTIWRDCLGSWTGKAVSEFVVEHIMISDFFII